MKKIILYFFMGWMVFGVTSCNAIPLDEGIDRIVGSSRRFTEEEIVQAINLVAESFSFPAATLTKIQYDEERSDQYIKRYLEEGIGKVNSMTAENVIVLLSDFDVDESGENPVLNPNTTYVDYQWILVRQDQKSKWEIDDWGY